MSQSETPSETMATPQQQQLSVDAVKSAPDKEQATEKPLSLADIFKEDESVSEIGADGKETPIETIDGLVKRLKLTPEQVYNIKVPMRDNVEPLTIGALKDRVGELVDLDTRELQFDQRRVKQEGELLRSQHEMREILSMIPREAIKPELVEKLRTQRSQMLEHEHTATLTHIPEWNDEKIRTADIKGMIDHLSDYGFPESWLQTVADHRALKYIRDNYLRDKRIKEALSKVKTPDSAINRRASGKPSRAAMRPDSRLSTSRRSGTPDNRARIMDILNASEK